MPDHAVSLEDHELSPSVQERVVWINQIFCNGMVLCPCGDVADSIIRAILNGV